MLRLGFILSSLLHNESIKQCTGLLHELPPANLRTKFRKAESGKIILKIVIFKWGASGTVIFDHIEIYLIAFGYLNGRREEKEPFTYATALREWHWYAQI